MFKITAYIVLVFLFLFNCNKEDRAEKILVKKKHENLKSKWDSLIKDSVRINLNKSGLEKKLVNLTQIEFLKSGEIVIPDGYSKTIFILKEDGALSTKISRNGRGPGEFDVISGIHADHNDNIYLFDPSQRKMIVYYSPDYTSFDEYTTKNYISNFTVISSPRSIVAYSPYFPKYLFNKVDLINNEITESALSPKDKNFKTWMSRIQTGGIEYDKVENTLYGLYPENLIVYKFNTSLELQAKIIPKSDKIFYKEFPKNLDPYGHDLRHEEWWATFNHLSRIKFFEDDKIIITYTGKSSDDNSKNKVFLNIYDIKNKSILAEDIELPERANLAGVRNGELYISYRAYLNENNEEVGFKLYKYSVDI